MAVNASLISTTSPAALMTKKPSCNAFIIALRQAPSWLRNLDRTRLDRTLTSSSAEENGLIR